MNLKKVGRETICLGDYATVQGLFSCSLMSLYPSCSNKYNSLCTHLIKHLINVFLKNSTLKHLVKIKHAHIKINPPNGLSVWVQ